MIQKWKTTGAPGIMRSLLIGCMVSMGITIIGSMILAVFLGKEKITEETLGYWIMGMLLLAAYAGGYSTCKIRKSNRLASSILTGTMYFALLMILGMLIFKGNCSGAVQTVLLILCGNTLAAMWTSRKNSTGKIRKFKFSNG